MKTAYQYAEEAVQHMEKYAPQLVQQNGGYSYHFSMAKVWYNEKDESLHYYTANSDSLVNIMNDNLWTEVSREGILRRISHTYHAAPPEPGVFYLRTLLYPDPETHCLMRKDSIVKLFTGSHMDNWWFFDRVDSRKTYRFACHQSRFPVYVSNTNIWIIYKKL
jgi:hypothetical protein